MLVKSYSKKNVTNVRVTNLGNPKLPLAIARKGDSSGNQAVNFSPFRKIVDQLETRDVDIEIRRDDGTVSNYRGHDPGTRGLTDRR